MAKDLTNTYKIDEAKGLVKYTIKAHGVYYTGKSKVNVEAGDVFDLEKGKRIAKLRAVLKMKRGLIAETEDMQNKVNDFIAFAPMLEEKLNVLRKSQSQVEAKLQEVLDSIAASAPAPEATKPVGKVKKSRTKKA
jgi:hypothetical protein